MRRLILILTVIIISFTGIVANATSNYLNEVVLEGTETGYNVILRSDVPTKVKKVVQSDDKIVLTLRGITVSDKVNTLYKNTTSANDIIIENLGNDELKVYINAKNVSTAHIEFNTPNSAPIPVGDKFAREKLLCTGTAIVFLCLLVRYMKNQNRRIVKKITMREREIEFYKANLPSINYKMAQKAYATSPLRTEARTLRQYQQDLVKQ